MNTKKPWTLTGKIEVKALSTGKVEVTHPGYDPGRWVGYCLDRENAANLIAKLVKALAESERLEKEAKERIERLDKKFNIKQKGWVKEEIREAAEAAQEIRETKTPRQAA